MKQHGFLKLVTGSALGVAAFLGSTAVTHADPPAGTGWDKNPDVVVGGGSDTTYLVSQRLEVLYNGAPGCTLDTGAASVNKGKCNDTTPAPTGPTNGNYDHDVMVSAAPVGSSAGVNALTTGGVQYNPAIDFARSSRGPSGTEAASTTFWGYARDGIAVISFGARTGVALTQTNLHDIYSATLGAGQDCTNNPPAALQWGTYIAGATGTIIPWDMNSASGTRAVFFAYAKGTDPNFAFGPCTRKLSPSGVQPFENDVKPLMSDPGPDGIFGTADDDENNYLWWISYGDWSKYPYTKDGFVDGNPANPVITSNLVSVGATLPGVQPSANNIGNGTYPITRILYHVTRNADADCVSPAGAPGACNNTGAQTFGATSGKGGAVRMFTEFLCRVSDTQQAVDPVTGAGYRTEIVKAFNTEGFQQLPATGGVRTPGYACSVST